MTQITIAGYTFTVPSPYEPGHVCNAAEAEVLNRKLHERLRANFRDHVTDFVGRYGTTGLANLQDEFTHYASTYTLGGPDPCLEEARVIALSIVKTNLRAAGKVVSDYLRSDLTKMAEEVLVGPQRGHINILARERVTALQKAARAELERRDANPS